MMIFKSCVLATMLLAQSTASGCGGNGGATDNNLTTTEQLQLKDQGRLIYEREARRITRNNELEQLGEYMHDMAQVGTTGYVTIYPPAIGQKVRHFKVRGKVLPCDAQLTPSQHQLWQGGSGGGYHDAPVVDQANDMGSYGGKSDRCVFFYTSDGVLVQTNNEYDYSSMPTEDDTQPVIFKVAK
ncbi:MAG: hypothetical protein JWM87_794 [Candidatus Eremiobacteraeota bacterium]|nr:hypothetical protein [Candidatus Eremiobacteraeota bacterium]